MAASSSSVVPTTRKGGWTYDVFLSFRGEDTRNNFVDHLFADLVRNGIRTFKDDKMLGGGQPISQELLKAIKESRWAVVVFSKHYANSSWCLEELSNIMECHKQMGGQKVFPVFYHVDPSDVRKQNGDFKIAFETHEDKFKGGEVDKVNKWRDALTAAASLSGQHISPNYGGEASFINKIVQQISSDIQPRGGSSENHLIDMRSKKRKLESTAIDMKRRKEHNDENTLMVPDRVPSWLEEAQVIIDNEGDSISAGVIERIDRLMEEKSNMEWTNEQIPLGMVSSATRQVPQDVTRNIFGSRKEIFQRALQLLEEDDTTQMVALCGMGGIGKTTMMEELKKVVENRKLFDRVVRVVIGNSTDPIAFQDAIAQYTGGNLSESTREARADRLKERFLGMSQDGKKKILIILDDLRNIVDLKDIGLASPLPKGFKLFLTSRYEMLCRQMGVETSSILRMVGLEEAEAKQLFRETTGLSDGAGEQVPQDVTRNIFGSRKEKFQRALQLLEEDDTTQMVALCGGGGGGGCGSGGGGEYGGGNGGDGDVDVDGDGDDDDVHSYENTLRLVASCEEVRASGINVLFEKTQQLHLEVEDMNHLEDILMHPSDQHSFCNLKHLSIEKCENLKYLFTVNVASNLTNLERLIVKSCGVLGSLIHDENNGAEVIKFLKLKHLVLKELPEFVGLCDNINIVMELPQLVRIILDDLPNITCIFASSNNISATTIPLLNKEVVSPKLEILDIQGMKNLKEIWEGEEVFTEIENFRNIVTPMTIKFDKWGSNNRSVEFIQDKEGLLRAVSKATNHYHDRNIIKDGGSGKVYKGKLSRNGRLMYIAVSRFNYIDHFRRELEFLSDFKHDNISSIFAYFDEDGENTIIYEHAFHGNLQGHLRNPALTWSRRLQICLDVARALNYIHNEGLIHCDINSSKILLDEDWEPRIFGFELCTEFFQSWTHRLHFCRYSDATSVMTPKYDVYLFGLLLFEVLCGKKTKVVDGFNGKVDDIIYPSLSKQIGSRSMQLFTKLAYNCLDKELVERPTMNQIVKELEEALKLQPGEENIERSTNRDEGALWNRMEVENLKIRLSDIRSATNNFEEKCLVGSGGFGKVYRAKLDVLDIQSVSSIKGNSKDELPRKRKTVAIKRLSKEVDEQVEKDFSNEIELLSVSKHPNVVSLLGYCREANERILVFEFASKGTLCDYLMERKPSLTWSQRIQICLHVAYGINYLHTKMEGKPRRIHRDIKSENILLDENLNAKVADFGLSRFQVEGKSTIHTEILVGTKMYIDPEYRMKGRYKKESDIYSFGVVLFEVLSGKMAYDGTYMRENDDGLAPIVRRRFNDGTLKELIDPKMLEDDKHTFTLNRGPTQDSYNLFSKVGYECLAKTQAERPTMEVIIKTLQHALEVQGGTMVISRFELSSIELATENFDKRYYMELDTYGMVYKAQLDHFESNSLLATEGKNNGEPSKKRISVVIKHISDRKDEHGEKGFFSEIEMHTRYKHPNIVPLLGFCFEGDNMLLVYEHASNGSLDNYLRDTDNMIKYTWIQRLHLCLGIAHGLNHLHNLMDRKQEMIHVDIRSANILLGKSGEVKIAYSGFSKLPPTNQEESTNTTNNNVRTKVYCYPEYRETRELKKQSDMYSFGVVLFEIFCGRLAYDPDYTVINDYGLAPIARRCFNEGKIMEMIDPALKERTLEDTSTSNREPILNSLGTYLTIANQCLAENQAERPTVQTVIKELEMALNIQGFSLDKLSGKKCYMLAARDLSIAWSDTPRYWRWISLPESRFAEVAELISVCWLQVHGTIITSLLSIDTRYAAYFVYKSTPNIHGFERYPAEVYIELSGVESQSKGQIKMVYLDPAVHLRIFDRFSMGIQSNAGPPLNGPKPRQDGWFEIELGEFFNQKEEGELKMTIEEVNEGNWKGGIIVQGIEIRPKAS